MAKTASDKKSLVRFTIKCGTRDTLSGMVQTEDRDEREQRAFFRDDGIATMRLPDGKYTFVWGVKMSPIQRHRYGLTVEKVPDEGDPETLKKRPTEQTTTGGEDVGFDDFILKNS